MRANHRRAEPATVAQRLSEATARAPNARPRASTCGAAGAPASTNWGRNATKKTIVLGLLAPTTNPVRSACPVRSGGLVPVSRAVRASERWRMAWTPSQTTYAAPATLSTV